MPLALEIPNPPVTDMNDRPIQRVRSLSEPPAPPSANPSAPAVPPAADFAKPPAPPRPPARKQDDDGPEIRNIEEIDRELDAASARSTAPAPGVPLKRQWDDDLEAELESAMAGFDASAFDVQNTGAAPARATAPTSRSRTWARKKARAPEVARGR